VVIDVRPRVTFASGHVPGTVNAGMDGPFATYVGWTMPWGLRSPWSARRRTAVRARGLLAHIGLDLPVGTAVPGPGARSDRRRLATFDQLADEWSGM